MAASEHLQEQQFGETDEERKTHLISKHQYEAQDFEGGWPSWRIREQHERDHADKTFGRDFGVKHSHR